MYGDNIFGKIRGKDEVLIDPRKGEDYKNFKFFTWNDNDYVTVYEPEIKDINNDLVIAYSEVNDNGIKRYYIDFKPCKYLDVTYKCELNETFYKYDKMEFNQLHPMYVYAIFQHLKDIDVNKHRGEVLKYDVFATLVFDIVITNSDNPEDVSRYRRRDFEVA